MSDESNSGARPIGRWIIAAGALLAVTAAAQTPDGGYGSIAAGKARMRVGPGREYPASWLYQRADLPVRVLRTYRGWKEIEDPDGTRGWMQANLLSQRRTAVIVGDVAELHAAAGGGRVQWRASPGVIGRISRCARGWCHFDVRGRAGFVEVGRLWGVGPAEVVE